MTGGSRSRAAARWAVVAMGFGPLVSWGPSAAEESPAHVTATMQEGAVTLTAREAPLREVLTEFGRVSGIAVHLEPSMVADESTTIAFDRMAPEDGVRQLLRAKNFILVYSGSSLAEVRAYEHVRGRPAVGVPVRESAADRARRPVPDRDGGAVTGHERQEGLRLRAKALEDPDPEERAMGIWELSTTDNQRLARETAAQVLEQERVVDVLESALMVLGRMDPVPLEPLLAFVNANRVPDSTVRIQALELMAGRGPADPRVKQLLVALASADRDAEVRESAQHLLETLVEH